MSAPAAPTGLRLELPATPGSVDTARLALLDFVAPLKPPPGALFNLELVLEEVLMNIAMHAYAGRDVGRVQFSATQAVDGITLGFVDWGPPFDATTAAEPRQPASLADAEPGGLGLRLLHRRARAMHYRRGDDGSNVLSVTVALA